MTVYNQEPRPRVLFEGISESVFHDLSPFVPTARQIGITEIVHESEYDLLVTASGNAGSRDSHLHVLSIGAESIGYYFSNTNYGSNEVSRSEHTLANVASIPDGVDSEVKKLIERTVLTTLPEKGRFTWYVPSGATDRITSLLDLGVEKHPYVVMWPRSSGKNPALLLALPSHVSDLKAWFLWFLQHLHTFDASTFPGEAEWASSPNWVSAQTWQLHESLELERRELAEQIAEAENRTHLAEGRLRDSLLSDSQGLQRLLTANGEELEAAVIEALTELGFDAKSMDEHHDKVNGAKLEDLRITDPDDPDWICLAEIKGYTRGVKTNDINQVAGKPLMAYVMQQGQAPSALWHVVNFNRSTNPATRGEAVPKDMDLSHLASLNGTLIDTRQLFLAVRDVTLGDQEANAVREGLRNSGMRWGYRTS